MPTNLTAHASTWNENDSATGDTATATHAAVSGESHYICGLIVGCSDYSSAQPDALICTVYDGAVSAPNAIIKFPFTSAGNDDNDPTGGPIAINFSNPLIITSGNPISVVVSGAAPAGNSVAYANMWGFTKVKNES